MDKKKELCKYRFEQAKETIGVAKLCLDNGHYKITVGLVKYASNYVD